MGLRICLGLPDKTCRELTSKTRCLTCTRAFYQIRGTARQRGYTTEYEKNRKTVLAQSRVCWQCGGYATTAGHVIDRIKGGGHNIENLRPECLTCNVTRGGALSRGGRGAL